MNSKHQKFIDLVVAGSSQKDAYKLCYTNKVLSTSVLNTQGSILAKKYAKEIQEGKDAKRKLIEDAHKQDVVQNALKRVMTQAEVDEKLSDIIRGECEVDDVSFFMGQAEHYKRKPNVSEINKAIDIYNKRFGSNLPIKTELAISNIPAPIIKLNRE